MLKRYEESMNDHERAVKAAKELSSHEGEGHKIINQHSEYLNGSLYVVGFEKKDGEQLVNYVYIEGSEITVCKNPSLLNELVSRKSKKPAIVLAIETLGGMAGIIGLVITGTIVYILAVNPTAEVPQILSAALTTILGFYFGSKSVK